MLTGSLGMLPSASLGAPDATGRRKALYEPIHGSAPDIAGKGLANPIALLRSGAMMLAHIGERSAAQRIERSIRKVLADAKHLTGDLGGKATTDELTDALIAEL